MIPKWSKAETCPLNVCCSKFGFCGTTEDFCGDEIPSVQVFHGYDTDAQPGQVWRVENTASTRDGFGCPDEELWYVGAGTTLPSNQLPADQTFFERFQRWSRMLFDDGYLATRGLNLTLTVSFLFLVAFSFLIV